MKPELPDKLTGLLHEWSLSVELPPRFNDHVWRQIHARARRTNAPLAVRFVSWIEPLFRRPAFAAAYLLVLLFLGLSTGLYQGAAQKTELQETGKAQYLQMVDPYQTAHSRAL